MKKLILFVAFAMMLTVAEAQIKIGGKNVNVRKAGQATTNMAKAVSLSDDDIYKLCREAVTWMDKHNTVAPDEGFQGGERCAAELQGLPRG